MNNEHLKLNRYLLRTVEHIHRVHKNMLTLTLKYRDRLELSEEDCRRLMHNVFNHDRSKFSTEQFQAYVELTEYYRQRKKLGNSDYDYPDGWRDKVDQAVEHHYSVENHHPEMFKPGDLGKWDRDNAIECVCDLQAMSQEFNEGSCRGYWEKVWLPKYRKKSGFYDDYNWAQIEGWMEQTIQCFEIDLSYSGE